MKKPRIPQSVQDARIALAKRALIEPFDLTYRTIEDAWIIVDSSWRAKLGGSFECAVCDAELSRYRTDLCREHEGYEFLLIHHSGSPAEHHQYAIRQLRAIAGLDENYLPAPKEKVPILARLRAAYYRIRP